MSLGRLLTSGKSLIGMQNTEGRYEMRPRNLLPKFGSEKNPFSTAKPEPLQAAATEKVRVETRVMVSVSMTPAEIAAARLKETRRLPAIQSIRPESEPASGLRVRARSAMERSAALIQKWNPWSAERRAVKAQAKPAIPRFDKTPVQTELSLDRIKVIRNDLSEADVEVVPMKISVQSPAKPVVSPAVPAAETAELIKS
jgi:hypothetical protein